MKAIWALVIFAGLATWLLTAAGFEAWLSAICVAVFIVDVLASWMIIARAHRGRVPPPLRGTAPSTARILQAKPARTTTDSPAGNGHRAASQPGSNAADGGPGDGGTPAGQVVSRSDDAP